MLWPIISSTLLLLWYSRSLIAKGASATYSLVKRIRLPGLPKVGFDISWVIERILYTVVVVAITLQVVGYQPRPDPGPNPPTPPVPPVVVVDGPRTLVIVRESEDDNPLFGQMSVALRFGDKAKILAERGHRVIILDDDETDEDGQPVPLLKALVPLNPQLPALFILDENSRVLHHETLNDLTADRVMKVLEDNGG